MANSLTTQSATPATIPATSKIATIDSGTPGHMQVMTFGATGVTRSDVAASATTVQILAASTTTRVGVALTNDSDSFVHVKCGTTASLTDFTIVMSPGAYWEIPFSYTGRIDALWDTATGSMRISEFTTS